MSGTSLDGIDIAHCTFLKEGAVWAYHIDRAVTISYSKDWTDMLTGAYKQDPSHLNKLHTEYGSFLGKHVNQFITRNNLNPELIASHGHTIFHQPDIGITFQLGDGHAIAAMTQLPVIYDFRSLDVSLGGQGAPLVPVGDKLLFNEYEYCLNLGGFGNISYDEHDNRIAFDICPVNIVLNHIIQKNGVEYDSEGLLARNGILRNDLLANLNDLHYYSLPPPKSLGREWVEDKFLSIITQYKYPEEDLLRTITEHIAIQVARITNRTRNQHILLSGGGSYNTFLVERIKELNSDQVILPDPDIIDYKEALIFAFLGILRWRNEINCLSSVTGAGKDSSSGLVVVP